MGARESKNKRRKEKAIAASIFPVGSCTCGGTLFLYLNSDDENVFNIYCTECHEIRDVREPKDGPIFWVTPQNQLKVLEEAYGIEKIQELTTDGR
jgi:hypothetical protein